jgi:hypothetical protein
MFATEAGAGIYSKDCNIPQRGVLDGRRSVLEFSDMQKKELLQRPTSLEIARSPST